MELGSGQIQGLDLKDKSNSKSKHHLVITGVSDTMR